MNADERRCSDRIGALVETMSAARRVDVAFMPSNHLRSSAFICGSHDRQRSAKHKGKAQWT